MDEQVDYGTSETFSLTPRLIAVKGEGLEPVTVSTVFLPTQIFSKASACLTTNRRIKGQQRETVKTVHGF
jgi:hypothetical protein